MDYGFKRFPNITTYTIYIYPSPNLAILEHKIVACNKRYSIIDQQIAHIFCTTVNVGTTRLPFYATQIINPFLKSRISANHDKEMRL